MPSRQELEQLTAQGSLNPEALAIRGEQAQRLRDAIQKLSPAYRIVLVLRDMEGLSDHEVAEITGLRPGTVRVRLHRARLFIRKELTRAGKPSGRNLNQARVAGGQNTGKSRPGHCKAMFAELSNYLDEQLDDSVCRELEQHMTGCEPCKAFLATLQATIEKCRSAPAERPHRKKAADLLRKLLSDYRTSARS